jgi:hypothetical protein
MMIQGLAQAKDWEKFNSSLLIEVTRPNGVFTCTGVALSRDLVVTAAHCLDGKVTKVRIFTQDHYDPSLPSLEVKDFELHPDYNPTKSQFRSDIAKIILKSSLPDEVRIHPVMSERKIMGQLLRFGFGEREKRNVRTVATPNLRDINLDDKVIILNDEFSRSGDSGGPIFIQDKEKISILAIHSTFSHGPEGNYSLNPILSAYLPWIFPH